MKLLGGIPVERTGNTTQAMKKSIECLNSGYNMLIHPEGTRTRDSSMLEFKNGVAKLSIDTGIPIVPVRIKGTFEIFPRTKKFPKIFRLRGKYPIKVTMGNPIYPEENNVEVFTQKLRQSIESLED